MFKNTKIYWLVQPSGENVFYWPYNLVKIQRSASYPESTKGFGLKSHMTASINNPNALNIPFSFLLGLYGITFFFFVWSSNSWLLDRIQDITVRSRNAQGSWIKVLLSHELLQLIFAFAGYMTGLYLMMWGFIFICGPLSTILHRKLPAEFQLGLLQVNIQSGFFSEAFFRMFYGIIGQLNRIYYQTFHDAAFGQIYSDELSEEVDFQKQVNLKPSKPWQATGQRNVTQAGARVWRWFLHNPGTALGGAALLCGMLYAVSMLGGNRNSSSGGNGAGGNVTCTHGDHLANLRGFHDSNVPQTHDVISGNQQTTVNNSHSFNLQRQYQTTDAETFREMSLRHSNVNTLTDEFNNSARIGAYLPNVEEVSNTQPTTNSRARLSLDRRILNPGINLGRRILRINNKLPLRRGPTI